MLVPSVRIRQCNVIKNQKRNLSSAESQLRRHSLSCCLMPSQIINIFEKFISSPHVKCYEDVYNCDLKMQKIASIFVE